MRSFVEPLGLRNSSLHQMVGPSSCRRTGTSGVGPTCCRKRPSAGRGRQGREARDMLPLIPPPTPGRDARTPPAVPYLRDCMADPSPRLLALLGEALPREGLMLRAAATRDALESLPGEADERTVLVLLDLRTPGATA